MRLKGDAINNFAGTTGINQAAWEKWELWSSLLSPFSKEITRRPPTCPRLPSDRSPLWRSTGLAQTLCCFYLSMGLTAALTLLLTAAKAGDYVSLFISLTAPGPVLSKCVIWWRGDLGSRIHCSCDSMGVLTQPREASFGRKALLNYRDKKQNKTGFAS